MESQNIEMKESFQSEEYKIWIADIKARYRVGALRSAMQINTEMLQFYWSVGADIVQKQAETRYGEQFFERFSRDLRSEFNQVRGFSVTNLRYMKKFYLFYYQCFENYPQLEEDLKALILNIPWGHQKYIIDRTKSKEEAVFYMQQVIANNYSRNSLEIIVEDGLFHTKGKAITNFSMQLPSVQGDLAQEITKDPYNFDFVGLAKPYKEKDLEDALVKNIVEFLLELGNGFAFVGRQYRIELNGEDNFIDLLFYNLKIRSYVVIELKNTVFKPEQLGQLGYYVSLVNHKLRTDLDNATVGLLICRSKDVIKARYALESTLQPIGISEYHITNEISKEIEETLPSIDEIEYNLNKKQ